MDKIQSLKPAKSVQTFSSKNNIVRMNLLKFVQEELKHNANKNNSVIFSRKKSNIITENLETKKKSDKPKESQSDSSNMSEDEELSSSDMSVIEEIQI